MPLSVVGQGTLAGLEVGMRPPVPKPHEQTHTKEQIAKAKAVVDTFFCEECHGGSSLVGSGAWIEDGDSRSEVCSAESTDEETRG